LYALCGAAVNLQNVAIFTELVPQELTAIYTLIQDNLGERSSGLSDTPD
jgi:hypothetical protein